MMMMKIVIVLIFLYVQTVEPVSIPILDSIKGVAQEKLVKLAGIFGLIRDAPPTLPPSAGNPLSALTRPPTEPSPLQLTTTSEIIWRGKSLKQLKRELDYHPWSNGVIPYEFDTSYNATSMARIKLVMKNLERRLKSCIRFKERSIEPQYVKIHGNGRRCEVDKYGSNPEPNAGRVTNLLLNESACATNHMIRHELLHVLGFEHTHQRSDRDDYVNIHWENIPRISWGSFVRKLSTYNEVVPFDYRSILMYHRYHHTIDNKDLSRKTITSKVNEFTVPADNYYDETDDLSALDFEMISIVYECGQRK